MPWHTRYQDHQKFAIMGCNLKTTRYSPESYDCTLYRWLIFCMNTVMIVHLATLYLQVHQVPAFQGHVWVLFSLSLRKVTVISLHSLHTDPKQGFRFRKGARFSFLKCERNTKMRNKPGKLCFILIGLLLGPKRIDTKSGNFLDYETLKRGYTVHVSAIRPSSGALTRITSACIPVSYIQIHKWYVYYKIRHGHVKVLKYYLK
jgi:hypothetical protein